MHDKEKNLIKYAITNPTIEPIKIFLNEGKSKKFTIVLSNQAMKVIYATANTLFKDEGEDAVLIGDVISNFFNDSGEHISTLYSDSAIVESFTNNLKAFGNVL